MKRNPPAIVMTTGDPAGIGPEILVKALASCDWTPVMQPLVVGSTGVLDAAIRGCDLRLELVAVNSTDALPTGKGVVPVWEVPWEGPIPYGVVDVAAGRAAITYIEEAARLVKGGHVQALVTGPINKEAIWAAGAKAPGHTEMLAEVLGVADQDVMTMFVVERLRIFFLTRHLPLRVAIEQLDVEMVKEGIRNVARSARLIGIDRPRIALAALNPHAGESGKMGTEDDEILKPAVAKCRSDGIDVRGPVPADAVFYHCRTGRYDAVLSLYHDQGHIAAKTLDFFGTVSCQLGLPVIRTAAEHGTAFDIAGKWIAEPRGQIEAMRVAIEMTREGGKREAHDAPRRTFARR